MAIDGWCCMGTGAGVCLAGGLAGTASCATADACSGTGGSTAAGACDRFSNTPQPARASSNASTAAGRILCIVGRSEEHTSELQVTNAHLVCRLLLEKKKHQSNSIHERTTKHTH